VLLALAGVLRGRYLRTYVPYGRYSNATPSLDRKFHCHPLQPVDARLAWFLMEIPNIIGGVAIMVVAKQGHVGSNLSWLLCFLFMFHYFFRTFIYPFLLRGSKPMPLDILCLGICFTSINGPVQTYYHLFETDLGAHREWHPLEYARVFVGLFMFFFGFYMNQRSDSILRNLRKDDNDKGYYIPHGFFFEYISTPNFVGEVIEWWGYAMVANTFVAYGFAVNTMITVGNRAIGHHQWYVEKFDDYPKQRKAFIPFLF
jgi:hypothetical protein